MNDFMGWYIMSWNRCGNGWLYRMEFDGTRFLVLARHPQYGQTFFYCQSVKHLWRQFTSLTEAKKQHYLASLTPEERHDHFLG